MKYKIAAALVVLSAGISVAMAGTVKTPIYTVQDGVKVDAKTYNGWKAWRAADCARCHGAQQQGMVGPSLIDSLKHLTKDQVEQTILNGRPGTMMPPHKTMATVAKNIDGLYAYLKGRSDGNIKPGHLQQL